MRVLALIVLSACTEAYVPEAPNACGSGVDRELANLAAVTAEQLGRWSAATDFELVAGELKLSPAGRAACAERGCEPVEGVLRRQRPVDWSSADADAFRAALGAAWAKQQLAVALPHRLERFDKEPAACGELLWYEARDCSSCSLDPERLSQQLLFAGYPDNPYLAFQAVHERLGRHGALVAINPTGGTQEGPTSSSADCIVACIKSSTTNLTGKCCTCNGVNKKFSPKAGVANTYVCR